MSYGKPKLTLKVGDRVKADPRNNGKMRDAEVISDQPRISALTAGSVEWLLSYDGATPGGRWVSEHLIVVPK